MSGVPPPRLAVIVPVRNEARFIEACLESILHDAPRGGIEVYVVDGMSDDGTADAVRGIARSDPRVHLLLNPSRFVPQAMNLGIAASSAPFIGRVDGHALVVPGYFAGCLQRLERGGLDCAGGVLVNEGTTPAGRAVAAATSSPVGVGSARFRTGQGGEAFVDTLAFGVYRREAFEKAGLFDETFVRNQDDELNFRLTRAGGRIMLIPSLQIRYFVRDSIGSLARQYYQYGYWKWRVFAKHGRFASWRHLAPSGFLIVLAALTLAAPFSALALRLLAAILGGYLLVVGGEALRLKLSRAVPWGSTAMALAVLHFSYGAGLLAALTGALLPGARHRTEAGPTRLSR